MMLVHNGVVRGWSRKEHAAVGRVIVRPDRKVIYSDCQWSSIFEAASAEDLLFETVSVVAGRRMEVAR